MADTDDVVIVEAPAAAAAKPKPVPVKQAALTSFFVSLPKDRQAKINDKAATKAPVATASKRVRVKTSIGRPPKPADFSKSYVPNMDTVMPVLKTKMLSVKLSVLPSQKVLLVVDILPQ